MASSFETKCDSQVSLRFWAMPIVVTSFAARMTDFQPWQKYFASFIIVSKCFFSSQNTSCFAKASMVLPLIQVGNTHWLQWSVPACLVCWESLLSSLENVCHSEKVTLKQKKQCTAEMHNYLIYISERTQLLHKLHTARFRHKPRCVQRTVAWLYSRTRWTVGPQSVSGGSRYTQVPHTQLKRWPGTAAYNVQYLFFLL